MRVKPSITFGGVMKKNCRKSFTVAELLIIIGISCIIISLILPAFHGTVIRSRLTACSNNLRKVGKAVSAYCSDNNGVIPPGITSGENSSTPVIRISSDSVMALGILLKNGYITEIKTFGCPDSPDHNGTSVKKQWFNSVKTVWSGYLYRAQNGGFDPLLEKSENLHKALIMDFACITPDGEKFSPHNYLFSNLLYADNHVERRSNTAEPFEFFTARMLRHNEITPDCTLLWQHADR